MNEEIKEAIEILKQANIETTTGCCEKCPVKNKNKTCIGCLDVAKKLLLNYITNLQEENQKLNKIIDELEKWLKERINRYEYSTGNMNIAAAGTLKATLNKLTELKKYLRRKYDNNR